MTQTIGIIGSGLVGKAVARLAIAAGYNVVISNSRGPETLSELVKGLGPRARAGSVEDAIAESDIVTISIPIAAFEYLPGDKFSGKIVLDQTNYYPGLGDFRRDDLDRGELTSSELIARHLKGAKVVKGLHNLSWIHMQANATARDDAGRTTLPISGDDIEAKQAVNTFLNNIGYDVIDAGPLADSWRIEPSTGIYFWRYAPEVPLDTSDDETRRKYQLPGKPLSHEEARKLVDEAVRPSPIGGTFEGMPQIHVTLFFEQASADTIKK